MKSSIPFLVAILGVPFLTAEPLPANEHPKKLPPVEPYESANRLTLKTFRSDVENKHGLILDARPETEYRKGHVPGALSLPADDFDTHYATLKTRLESDKSQLLILYCSNFSCKASDHLQEKLFALGYAQIALFPNGWAAWQQAQLPVEKTE